MDPALLRHVGPFSGQGKPQRGFSASSSTLPGSTAGLNNDSRQNSNSASRPANLDLSSAQQPSSLWDTAALSPDAVLSESPLTAPARSSLYSFGPTSTAPTDLSFNATSALPSPYSQSTRVVLPTRTPRRRDGHEKKRSKLSTDASNMFDSVDYWIQFDNEDANQDGSRPDQSAQDSKMGDKATLSHRSSSIAQAMPSASGAKPSVDAMKAENALDDSALDNALSDEEDGLSSIAELLSRIDSMPPSEVPPREGLYSTPLSWDRPNMGWNPRHNLYAVPQRSTLSDSEQQRLIAIAMGHGSSVARFNQNPYMNFGGLGMGFGADPTVAAMSQFTDVAPQPKPSKQSTNRPSEPSPVEKAGGKPKPGERTAHNDIERKYRTKLKDKIAELRDAVPSLKTIPEDSSDEGEGSTQPSRAAKVSKGTVLTKATEYIHYLEKRNTAMTKQHQELSRRIQAFEVLLSAATRPSMQMPSHSRTLFDPRAFC